MRLCWIFAITFAFIAVKSAYLSEVSVEIQHSPLFWQIIDEVSQIANIDHKRSGYPKVLIRPFGIAAFA